MNEWIKTYDPRAAEEIFRGELEWLKQRIAQNIILAGANASGQTIASMEVKTTSTSGTLLGRNYFGTLETGRRAGKIPRNFGDIIYEWMQAKGIHANDGKDMNMAWAIAKTIARLGTTLHPPRGQGRDTIYSQEILRTTANIHERISGLFSLMIGNIKLNIKDGGLIK